MIAGNKNYKNCLVKSESSHFTLDGWGLGFGEFDDIIKKNVSQFLNESINENWFCTASFDFLDNCSWEREAEDVQVAIDDLKSPLDALNLTVTLAFDEMNGPIYFKCNLKDIIFLDFFALGMALEDEQSIRSMAAKTMADSLRALADELEGVSNG